MRTIEATASLSTAKDDGAALQGSQAAHPRRLQHGRTANGLQLPLRSPREKAEPAELGSEGHDDMTPTADRMTAEVDCEQGSLHAPLGRPVCPVEALAEDAAAHLRLNYRLLDNHPAADHRLIQHLDDRISGAARSDLLDACSARQSALCDLAGQRRAASAKGAIFQLYVVAARLTDLDDVVCRDQIPAHVIRNLDAWREEIRRLLYSATSYVEQAGEDADLRLLRGSMLPPEFDVAAELEQLARAEAAA